MENGNNQFPYDQSKDSAAKSTKSDYEQLDPQTLQNITNAFFQRSQNVNTEPPQQTGNIYRNDSYQQREAPWSEKEERGAPSGGEWNDNRKYDDDVGKRESNRRRDVSRSRSRSRSRSQEKKKYTYVDIYVLIQIISFVYCQCCERCKKNDKNGKTCVCVVPASQRRLKIGADGCSNCHCKGCTKEDRLRTSGGGGSQSQSRDRRRERSNSSEYDLREFCCRECKKPVTKEGKPCICHAPKGARIAKIGDNGCKLCGCRGCNPDDHKERQSRGTSDKYSRPARRSEERGRQYSDVSDEEYDGVRVENLDNFDRSAIANTLMSNFNIYLPLIGFGVPQRTYSYIYGKPKH